MAVTAIYDDITLKTPQFLRLPPMARLLSALGNRQVMEQVHRTALNRRKQDLYELRVVAFAVYDHYWAAAFPGSRPTSLQHLAYLVLRCYVCDVLNGNAVHERSQAC